MTLKCGWCTETNLRSSLHFRPPFLGLSTVVFFNFIIHFIQSEITATRRYFDLITVLHSFEQKARASERVRGMSGELLINAFLIVSM